MFKNYDHVTLIYDNACNFLRSMILRFPALAKHFSCVVDTMHFSGHKMCSPFFNKRFMVALRRVNSAIAEQKNRFINYMKTSVAFMGQARAMVHIR
jgi:hypothetical protein